MSVQSESRPFEGLPSELSGGVNPDDYKLSPEALGGVEQQLVAYLKDEKGAYEGVVGAVIDSTSEFASFGRTSETIAFPGYDFSSAMKPYETRSLFVYTVDLDLGKVAHVKRLVRAVSEDETMTTGLTGIEIIDDRLKAENSEEVADLVSLLSYHGLENAAKSLNVTTNMTTHRAEPSREKPYGLMSYKALFEMAMDLEMSPLFAYLNPLAIKSLGRLGVEYDKLLGKEFHLPIPDGYDHDYLAICIPASEQNTAAFTKINPEKPFTKMIADRKVPLYTIGLALDLNGLPSVS